MISKQSWSHDSKIFDDAKALVDPSLATLSLWALAYICDGRLGHGYGTLGVIAFLLSFPGKKHFRQAIGGLMADVTKTWAFTCALLFSLAYFLGLDTNLDRSLLVAWAIVAPLLIISFHWVAPRVLPNLLGLQGIHRAIVIGANDLGKAIARTIDDNPMDTRRVIAFFDDRNRTRLDLPAELPLTGLLADAASYAKANRVNVIYIALPMASQQRILQLLDSLKDTTASIYFVPDVLLTDLIESRIDFVGRYPVVAFCESPQTGVRAILKRLLDIVVAAIAIVATLPVMVTVATAIRLTSPGPILFRQRRYGLGGEEIWIWKFRSMAVMEDGVQDYRQVTRSDARVTPVGRFIRRTSIDELPQLFNVLSGSMSIVGPRPHVTAVNENYRKLIPGYMWRHKVKPGITGWAQINGCRGGDDLESIAARTRYDLDYLRRWSLGFDLWIMAKTLRLLATDTKAF